MDAPTLEIDIYQLAGDDLMKANRQDGTGWDWRWASSQRPWMDATQDRFAYRCLPLTIANQTGWWVLNPVGFSALWSGGDGMEAIQFWFDSNPQIWSNWVKNNFGSGIITWNTPFLFRTRPSGSRLLVSGPTNSVKPDIQPLTAIIETDWMTMSFTMNWKFTAPNRLVRFEAGEPLFQVIPLTNNICGDLETASVTYQYLSESEEISHLYREWDKGRRQFMEKRAEGQLKPGAWQKEYFQGKDGTGQPSAPTHMTKVNSPKVSYSNATNPQRVAPPAPVDPISPWMTTATATPSPAAAEQHLANPENLFSVPTREVNDDWRRWIAENLLLTEGKPQPVADAMMASGFTPPQIAAELSQALNSPYLRGAERLRNRLRKRDWQLATYRKLQRLRPATGQVERRGTMPRDEFLERYYAANRPVVITGLLDGWPAMSRWSLDDFANRLGDREVEVQYGRSAEDDYELQKDRHRRTIRFADFLDDLRHAGVTNDFYMTANNDSRNKLALPELWDDIKPIPEYLDSRATRAGFLWIGPGGTLTPFHHDLTNNLLTQVIGRKAVKIVPSWDMPLMANHRDVFSAIDGRGLPAAPAPPLDEPQVLECEIGPGDALFLPIGCMHFVEALDISVSVSFTNFVFDNDFNTFYNSHGDL